MNKLKCTYVRKTLNNRFEVVAKSTLRLSKVMGRYDTFETANQQAIKLAEKLSYQHVQLARY
jgi:hypothetical protein